jgi:hypothetical protein
LVVSGAVRVLLAASLGWLTWWCYLNSDRFAGVARVTYYALDWPVATAGQLFPRFWAGIDVHYRTNLCDLCTSRELLSEHLKFAVPVYVLLSYVATYSWRRWRRRFDRGSNDLRAQVPSRPL